MGAGGWRAALSSLEIPRFRWLFFGNLTFFFAMQGISMVLRPLLAYELAGKSPAALGLVQVSVAIPMILMAPLGGTLSDRYDRRRLIVSCQIVLLVSEIATASLLYLGHLRFWHIVALALVIGAMFAVMMPSRQAIVANVVGRGRLGNAIALTTAGMNVSRVGGPLVLGALIPLLTPAGGTEVDGIGRAYLLATGLYVVALLAMIRVGPALPPPEGRERSIVGSTIDGFRYLRSNRLVLMLLVFGLMPMFLMMPFQALLPVFADTVYGRGSGALGLLNGVAGVGGFAGAVILATRGEHDRRVRTMLGSVCMFGLFLGLFAFSGSFWLALAWLLLANVFQNIFGVVNNTAIQQLIPDSVRGRISSFLMMSFSLPMFGSLPVSLAAERWGAPAALGGASVLAVALAIAFVALSPGLRHLDAAVRHAVQGAESSAD